MDKIKNWIQNWLIKYFLTGVVKGDLNGKKFILGIIGIVLTGITLVFGHNIPAADVISVIITSLPKLAEGEAPITPVEVAAAITSFIAMWGAAGKIIKLVLKIYKSYKEKQTQEVIEMAKVVADSNGSIKYSRKQKRIKSGQ